MSKTITKGALFSVQVEVDDERLAALKNAPDVVDKALQTAVEYWHTKVLPEHFKKDAHAKYGYAQRSRNYLKQQRGKPDLVASGSLARDLKARASFNFKKSAIEMRMTARVLNLVPRMQETNPDSYVQHGGRRGAKKYPNLKREIRVVIDAEHEALAAVFSKEVEIGLQAKDGGMEV